jgi:hypothetical protein
LAEFSFWYHRNCFTRTFLGAYSTALAKIKIGGIIISHIYQALWRAVERTNPATAAFGFIGYGSCYPPISRVKAKELAIAVGPGSFAGENKIVFNRHGLPPHVFVENHFSMINSTLV